MTPQGQRLARGLLATALFVAGAILHLGLLDTSPDRIWGDHGDGFFNLWLLDHTYESVRRGDVAGIPDGRIFAPEPGPTFFWSDNLLVPALPYSVLRVVGLSRFAAFWWTGLLLAAGFFAALHSLFGRIIRLAVADDAPAWALWLPAPAAYIAFFAPGILGNFFQHFQNLSALWLFVMTSAMLDRLLRPGRGALVWIGIAQVAMLYSSLYFAVVGFVLVLLWGLFELMRDASGLVRDGIRALPALAPLLLAALWIGWQYTRVPHIARSLELVKSLSIDRADIYTPSGGTLHRMLTRTGVPPRAVHHEKSAWPGLGLLTGMLLMLPATAQACGSVLRRRPDVRWIAGLLLAAALCASRLRGLETVRAFAGLAAIGGACILTLRACASGTRSRPAAAAVALTLLLAAVAYGLAFGPHSRFMATPVNLSIWGLFATFTPGLVRMRAIGRLAMTGQSLLMTAALGGAVLIAARGQRAARRVAAGLILTGILQFADIVPLRAYSTRTDPATVTPTVDEDAFLATLSGTALVLPAGPFHGNAHWMLFASRFGNLRLMNGYSSRSTDLWDRIMAYGTATSEGNPDQLAAAREAGADWLIVFKRGIHRHWLHVFYTEHPPPLFDNERMLVYPLATGR